MRISIEEYINKNFKLENLISKNSKEFDDIKDYYNNAKKDAIYSYSRIKNYLNQDTKILEVGGGIHLLTNYLMQYYNVTSIEPGNYSDGYANNVDFLRESILKENKNNIYTTTLEKFVTNDKYDFIFSMNVVEHTNDIKNHIECCIKLLRNNSSIIFIECPNYSFPYEPHFREFFIPLYPSFTFKSLKQKKLIKKYGIKKYNNILNNINFNCNFNYIKKIGNIKFVNPIEIIFKRIDEDIFFKQRLFSNFFIKLIYNFIKLTFTKKLLIKFFPKTFYPYLIFTIKKDF